MRLRSLDLVGVSEEVAKSYRGVLVSPLLREDGAFGAISLYSKSRTSYTTEHVRLLESVCQHASTALNNAMTFEKTKESALVDPLTELPNARGFYMMLEQRIAECQRMSNESLAVVSMDVDDFKRINDQYGHAIGDRVLASGCGCDAKRTQANGYSDSLRRRRVCRDHADGFEPHGGGSRRTNSKCGRSSEVYRARRQGCANGNQRGRRLLP